MKKEGTIRLMNIYMNHFEKEEFKLCQMAIAGNTIVPITKFSKTKRTINFMQDGKEVSSHLFKDGLDRHLTFPFVYADGWQFLPVSHNLWQLILDNKLDYKKVEFDDSEKVVTKFTYFRKPQNPVFNDVFKIKVDLQRGVHLLSICGGYQNVDYATREEAMLGLAELEKKFDMNVEDGDQYYFTVEKMLKRQEYEKVNT